MRKLRDVITGMQRLAALPALALTAIKPSSTMLVLRTASRRGSHFIHALPNNNVLIQRRNLFGLGEILGVIANPADTLRSLAESRRLLEETRQEMRENRERAQIRPPHTFNPLPGFFARPAEMKALESSLEGIPSFTVLFGASSVGKTALLREVLSCDKFHVLHFDLRIAGFADLASLYFSLAAQMEQYWEALSKDVPGYEEFEKESWPFKHDRIDVERRLKDVPESKVTTSDIARLMELFQSSLLKYWQFQPKINEKEKSKSEDESEEKPQDDREEAMTSPTRTHDKNEKKIPVIFFDEAHKLPALIQSTDTMKTILDSFLVLTKQDRLCHVIHATSDPFYQTWLRQLNVMQHCKIISIGDCSKEETKAFFEERLLPSVPEEFRLKLNFGELYQCFGGKLAHWSDYITDFVNAKGDLPVRMSSHFLQAHALLNLHLLHARSPDPAEASSNAGFRIYSPLAKASPHASPSPQGVDENTPELISSFTASDLLTVMERLTSPALATPSLSYFSLCRELGTHVVDSMVRGRLLELRWSKAVTQEGETTADNSAQQKQESVGPQLVPTTPIIAYAMKRVLKEYGHGEADGNVGQKP